MSYGAKHKKRKCERKKRKDTKGVVEVKRAKEFKRGQKPIVRSKFWCFRLKWEISSSEMGDMVFGLI
jgi:hypothetical protein